jgi:phage I-like protein
MATASLINLNGKSFISLAAKAPILGKDSDKTWVQMAYEGTFAGHVSGPFSFNKKSFGEILTKFNSVEQPVPITYGHPSGDGAPAAGFIIELETRSGKKGLELWGLCQFTKKAAASIREGEYKFSSVVVDFASIDRVSGKSIGTELYQLGLTNNPFLEGMAAISLSKINQRNLNMKSDKVVEVPVDPNAEPVLEVEGVCPNCSKTECACKPLAVGDAPIAEATEEVTDETESPEEVAQEVVDPMMECKEICDMLSSATGLDIPTLSSAVKNNLDSVSAAINKTATASKALADAAAAPVAPAPLPMSVELSAYKNRSTELQTEVDALRATVVELSAYKTAQTALETKARHEASFSRLLSDGKITAAQKELFLSAVNTNEEMAIKLFDGMPSNKPPTEHRVTGLSASPVKAPQGSPVIQDKLDETDPSVKTLRLSARGQGLTGIHADAWIRKALAIKATHSGN